MNRIGRILVLLLPGLVIATTLHGQERSSQERQGERTTEQAGSGQSREGETEPSLPDVALGRPDASQEGEVDASQRGQESSQRRRSFRLRPGRTSVTLLDKKVSVIYGPLPVTGQDYENLETQENGTVVQFLESFAIKLLTDADLKFGDTVVAAHNTGESYPGVYSLWLKKVDEGWSLLFNEEADVWVVLVFTFL